MRYSIGWLLLFFSMFLFGSASLRAENFFLQGSVRDSRTHTVACSTSDGQYDFSYILFRGGLESYGYDWPRIIASGTPIVVNKENNEETALPIRRKEGRVIVIFPYVLVPYHIVDLLSFPQTIATPMGSRVMVHRADRVREEEYWFQERPASEKISLRPVIFLPESELALFKLSSGDGEYHLQFTLGLSRQLRLGHKIFILGSPGLMGSFIREGIIANLQVSFPKSDVDRLGVSEWLIHASIGISSPVLPGDSGSPVIALRDGSPELVGILNINLLERFGIMIGIDRVLEKIQETTGIDLRQQDFENHTQKLMVHTMHE